VSTVFAFKDRQKAEESSSREIVVKRDRVEAAIARLGYRLTVGQVSTRRQEAAAAAGAAGTRWRQHQHSCWELQAAVKAGVAATG
jgi:hypothetical protein